MKAIAPMAAKPELLAPAGTIEAALAAFDAGADAVYAGLQGFNARRRSRNLTEEELGRLIAWSRRRGRRVYVTVNTLVKDQELPDVADLLGTLYSLRPDAVIVQDLGVVRLLRRHFPELAVHASTQMAVHNSAGVRFLETLGVERVILERQITFDELRTICERTSIGVEVFVHGALCCSRSGVCLFSSWIGGHSGNRGRCTQPCRRRYFSQGGNGFFFSPADLCVIEAIPDLRRFGVAGLKIEGRLRGPEYVRTTVAAYRLVLDASDDEIPEAVVEARRMLSHVPSRRLHGPFRSLGDLEDVIHPQSPGTAGRPCGVVQSARGNRFTAVLSKPLRVGDVVRLQTDDGAEGASAPILAIRQNGRNIHRARPGAPCELRWAGRAAAPARIYHTGHISRRGTRPETLPAACRRVLDLSIAIDAGNLRVRTPQFPDFTWQTALPTQPARRRETYADTVAAEFARTGRDTLAAGRIRVETEPGLFVPASALKAARRQFWNEADRRFSEAAFRACLEDRLHQARTDLQEAPQADHPPLPPETTRVQVLPGAPPRSKQGERTCLLLTPDGPLPKDADEIGLPDFCPEADLDRLTERLAACLRSGIQHVRVTSLYGLTVAGEAARRSGHRSVDVVVGFPLPVCNTQAVRFLLEHGCRRMTAWVELDRPALEALVERASRWLEVVVEGSVPVLATRMVLPVEGRITDDHGRGWVVRRAGPQTLLFPERPVHPGCRHPAFRCAARVDL